MDSIINILQKNKFTISVELVPPRNGTDLFAMYEMVETLDNLKVNFLSVTHGAGGSLRGGTLPICHYAQNNFNLNSIAHLTVRGLSKESLENLLIDHYYFGIKNILALRGDPPDNIQATFKPAEDGYSYAYELVQLIHDMRQGRYLIRKNFDKTKGLNYREGVSLDFCIGVASYPEDTDEIRIAYLQKKIDLGADFSITQMILSEKTLFSFIHELQNKYKEFPILPGLRIPNSYDLLLRLQNKFQISVDKTLLNNMQKASPNKEDMKEVGLTWASNLIKRLEEIGVSGVHLFIMGDITSVKDLKKII